MTVTCEKCKEQLALINAHICPIRDMWLCDTCYYESQPWESDAESRLNEQDGEQC